MTHPLLNAMRLQAERNASERVSSRIGKIVGYNPNNYTARAELQPEVDPTTGAALIQTGWLQIAAQWVGPQWGMYAPPNIGDMCLVEFVDSDINDGIINGRFWNDDAQPLVVQSGEFWLVHAQGAFFKLTNDGKLTFSDGQGAQIQLDGAGNIDSQATTWTHTGDMHVTGNLTVDKTVTGTTDVVGGSASISLKGHKHTGVQTGGGETGGPTNS